MIYLVSDNIFTYNSGVEWSQIQRLNLFNQYGYETKFLTKFYNRFLYKDAGNVNVKYENIINMYDFFQNRMSSSKENQNLRLLDEIPLDKYHINYVDGNHSELLDDGKLIGTIHVLPGTVSLIGDIEYYDYFGHITSRELWDWRGFKSSIEIFHPDGRIASQRYLNADGQIILEKNYMNSKQPNIPTMIKLTYHHKIYFFDTEDQLFLFFINIIVDENPGMLFVDNPYLNDVVLHVDNKKVSKFSFVHSNPFMDLSNPVHSNFNPIFNTVLSNQDFQFDKVIVPTYDECKDIRRNKHLSLDKYRIVSLPDTYTVRGHDLPKKLGSTLNFVYAGRLFRDKNIINLIKLFNIINSQQDNVNLSLQGYFESRDYENEVINLIKALNLSDKVRILKYSNHLDNLYKDATFFINLSSSEGFGMNMLESMMYGVPVFSTNNKYVNVLIKNKINGFLLDGNSLDEYANIILQIISNLDETYYSISKGAIDTANNFDKEHFIRKWSSFLKEYLIE